jgi:hypothetical protein
MTIPAPLASLLQKPVLDLYHEVILPSESAQAVNPGAVEGYGKTRSRQKSAFDRSAEK